jgi:DNA helicase-2/ATP-dependent DNA helicase PcrA
MFEARLVGRAFSEDDLVEAFRTAWVSEGFLSREHEERRQRVGEEMLRRFFHEETASAWAPTAVEQEFTFDVERNRIRGRYDLVAGASDRVTIVDFKTGEVADLRAARKRADESLQLDIYALAHLRTRGRLPDRVELRFLESGLAAGRTPTLDDVTCAEERIRSAADGIRRREFPPRPTWMACGQCPFREICPHTARGRESGS